MYRKRNNVLSLASLAALTVILAACGGTEADDDPTQQTVVSTNRTVRVNTLFVELTSFEEVIPITGTVSAPSDATLSAQSAGTVVELLELGSHVKKGGVVARLDDRLISAILDQASANLKSVEARAYLAQDTYRRQQPLFQDSIISAIEFENVRAQLNEANAALAQANAAVAQAEQQFENTFVRAPFNGTIEERFAEKGEQVVPGSSVARIVDTSHLKVNAGVPERYSADIRRGNSVEISFRSYGGLVMTSSISFVGSVIHPQNRTFTIEVEITNPDRTLKPEMIADVFVTRRVLTDKLVLPQTSILRDETGSSVYVVRLDATNGPSAELRPIVLGGSYGGLTVIESGLSDGDQVITTGQTMVTEGDLLDIVNDAS